MILNSTTTYYTSTLYPTIWVSVILSGISEQIRIIVGLIPTEFCILFTFIHLMSLHELEDHEIQLQRANKGSSRTTKMDTPNPMLQSPAQIKINRLFEAN